MKKTIIAFILVLASTQVWAEETDSRCGQIDDGPERVTREVESDDSGSERGGEATEG